MSPIEIPDALWAIVVIPEWPETLTDGSTITAFVAELTFCDAPVYRCRYEHGGYDSDTFDRALSAVLGADFDRGIQIITDAFKQVCADRMRYLLAYAFDFASRPMLAGRGA